MFFGLGKSTDTSRAGIGFNWKNDGFGVTAYNATFGTVNEGDCVVLHCTGTSGQEWKAMQPTAARGTYGMFGVALETCSYQSIGKFLIFGKAQARVIGHASLAVNSYLEMFDYIDFDGTATNLRFVAGSGTTRDTITDSDSGLVTDGFLAGMQVVVYGSTSNDGTYEIYSIAAGTMTLTTIGGLTSEVGKSGMTVLSHGYLRYDGAADTANSWAIAREAYTTTTAVALKDVQLQGLPKILATS